MIRYAIIGTGWITKSFIKGCELTGSMKLEAVYSRTLKKANEFAEEFGCKKSYTDLKQIITDKDIDAVYIASPNSLHYSQSKLMLENGKHVICEKPVAASLDEVTELIDIAKQNKLIFTEAIMERYLPARRLLLNAVSEIGGIKKAEFNFSQLSSRYNDYLNGNKPNVFNPEMAGGALMDLGIYCVYAAVECFGIPVNIKAEAEFLKTGCDGSGKAVLEYGDKDVTLIYCKTEQVDEPSVIYGEKGTVYIDSVSKMTGISLVKNGNNTLIFGDMEKPELMSFEAKAFSQFINGEKNEEYKTACELMLKVHKIMSDIREISGISFIKS